MDVAKDKLGGREEFEEDAVASRRCMLDGEFWCMTHQICEHKVAATIQTKGPIRYKDHIRLVTPMRD